MAKQIKIETCANGYVVTVIDVMGAHAPAPASSPSWSPRDREYVFQRTSDMFEFIDGQINPTPCMVPTNSQPCDNAGRI